MEPAEENSKLVSAAPSDLSTEDQLRRLLLNVEVDNEEWQVNTGRLVSQIHVKTLNSESTDSDFLVGLSLIFKAQQLGCKEAKKKSLNLARYKDRSPSGFNLTQDAEEQKAIFTLLNKIQSDWCAGFISEQLRNASLDKVALPLLIKWASKTSPTPSIFWKSALQPILESEFEEKTKISALKEFDKSSVEFIKPIALDQSLKEFSELLDLLSKDISAYSDNKKIVSAILSSCLAYTDAFREAIPNSIVDINFVSAISDFSVTISKTDLLNDWQKYCEKLASASASVLNSITKSLGPYAAEYWGNHLKNLTRAYPTVRLCLKAFAADNPFIALVLGEKTVSGTSANFQYESESNVTSLLQAWQNYKTSKGGSDATETLHLLITRVAKTLGIEYFGDVGSSYAYDPIEHNLLNQESSTSKVTILQQGIRLTRRDGSIKIMHPAIVK
jgi:hypothetical protein